MGTRPADRADTKRVVPSSDCASLMNLSII